MTDLELTRDELELWERIVLAHVSCPDSGNSDSAVRYADSIIKARRKRFETKKGDGPFR